MGALNKIAIRSVWHIRTRGADDVFKPPLFHPSIEAAFCQDPIHRKHVIKEAEGYLSSHKITKADRPTRFNIPKSRYAFRSASWMEFPSVAGYLALVLSEAHIIEAARRPIDEKSVFSYRYKSYGRPFRREFNYASFRERSHELSKTGLYQVKINTDIANFYDRLNIHRLESSLINAGCSEKFVKKINELLLIWAGRNSYGLPVGCDGSRLLAEAALINVDNELVRRDVTFVRYVDDYRIFAKDYLQANTHLNILIEALDNEGLFLNTSKTKMIDLTKNDPETESFDKSMEEFESVDENEKVEILKRVANRYASRLVKTYRMPGKEKIREYRKIDLKNVAQEIESDIDVNENFIRQYLKGFIYQDPKDIPRFLSIIERNFHFMPYFVDALIKEANRFTNDQRREIHDYFYGLLFDNRCAAYYRIAAIRLCSAPKYVNLLKSRDYFDRISIQESPITLHEFVLQFGKVADRDLLVCFKSLYWNVTPMVRRAILYSWRHSNKVINSEKRAFFKTIHKTEADPLLVREAGKLISADESYLNSLTSPA